jgi:hypothetical protein
MGRSWLALAAGAAIGAAGGAVLIRLRPGSGPVDPADDGLGTLTRNELYERARVAEIPGRSRMTKDELIRALRDAS